MAGLTLLDPFGFLVFGYIGPGAGFAFAGYVMIVLTALLVLLGAVLLLPLRMLVSPIRHRNRPKAATRRRVILLGLDGLDPGIVDTLFARGELPNLHALAEAGGFCRLQSTTPPISPVAWSTFMTGANPGKHNIFDFVSRDPRTYQLRLSTADMRFRPRRPASRPAQTWRGKILPHKNREPPRPTQRERLGRRGPGWPPA
jgi:hypothetical protein